MNFFRGKVNGLISGLPPSQFNPLKWIMEAKLKWKHNSKVGDFTFKNVNLNKTIHLISGLANSTSSGIDHIDSLAIKAAVTDLAPPLMHLINTSLQTSKYGK